MADVRRLRERMGAEHPRLPCFLLGHSMGSFLARTYLIRYPGTLAGCILSGTGQERAPLVALGKLLSGIECRRLGPQGVSPLVDALSGPLDQALRTLFQRFRRRADAAQSAAGAVADPCLSQLFAELEDQAEHSANRLRALLEELT